MCSQHQDFSLIGYWAFCAKKKLSIQLGNFPIEIWFLWELKPFQSINHGANSSGLALISSSGLVELHRLLLWSFVTIAIQIKKKQIHKKIKTYVYTYTFQIIDNCVRFLVPLGVISSWIKQKQNSWRIWIHIYSKYLLKLSKIKWFSMILMCGSDFV